MKKLFTILLSCSLIVGFTKCSNRQSITDNQRSIIKKQVDSTFHTMIKKAENLNYDALSKGVDDRHSAGFITNGSYFEQYNSLISTLKSVSKGVSRQSITINHEKITVLSENIVLLVATGITKVDVDSGDSFTVKFLWSFVYERVNNNWKVVHSHQSRLK